MFVVYITREPATGRYYIGKTRLAWIERGYVGSGLWPVNARRKGRTLAVEVLLSFEVEEDAYVAELFFVQCHKDDALCMNIATGGEGGMTGVAQSAHAVEIIRRKAQARWDDPDYKAKHWPGVQKAIAEKWWGNKERSAAERAKRAVEMKAWWAALTPEQRKASDAAKENMAAAQRGRKHTAETKNKIGFASARRVVSEETRAKLSAAQFARQARERKLA